MAEFIHHFGIDWKLLLAQAVNFIVLVVILRKFAYGPIMRILDERKKKIEEGLRMRKEAEELLNRTDAIKQETIGKANVEALEIVNRAQKTAQKRHEEIMEAAEKKVEGVVAGARKIIEGEKEKMRQDVEQDAEYLVRSGIAAVLGRMPASERDELLIKEAMTALKNAV